MSLRITVEKVPSGPGPVETLAVIDVTNTKERHPHGPADLFRYDVECTPGEADDARHDRAHYVGPVWHCRSHGWWRLVGLAFSLRERKRA